MIFMATTLTNKFCLVDSIFFCCMATVITLLASVMRRYTNQSPASPLRFIFKLPNKLTPSLFQDRAVQSSFLSNTLPWLFNSASSTSRYILYFEILYNNESVVFADFIGEFMKIVIAFICNFFL